MERARAYLDDIGRQADDPDRRLAVHRGPVAELAVLIPAPTRDGVVFGERARVITASRDRGDAVEARDVHRDHVHLRRRVVSDLVIAVPSPARDRAIRQQGARVEAADGDLTCDRASLRDGR
jgi:hypothetical protein